MKPEIRLLKEKKLVGMRMRMSFAAITTPLLWQRFMPRRKEISNSLNADLFSLEVYDDVSFFKNFNPSALFDKWAAVEVSSFDTIPVDMETLIIPEGLYAVFLHKGPASGAQKTYEYIFRQWLPGSGYVL